MQDGFNESRIGHTKCSGLDGLALYVGVSVSIRVFCPQLLVSGDGLLVVSEK